MASTDMQRLVVALEARTAAFEKAMNRANGVANRRARAIESRFAAMNKRIGTSMLGIGRGWVAGIAAGIGARQVKELTDTATRIDNALKVAGLSGAELEKVYGNLRNAAIKNAAPLEALVELYSRAALVQGELGVTSEDLVGFSNDIAMALRVSGKTAQESSGALLQLSQALGSGVVRAEEFNSMLEGAPTILQAAASGIKEAGGSVSKLRTIMLEGELSSRALFEGIRAGASVLEDRLDGVDLTVSQAMGNLNTALIDAAREFENATGWSERFAGGINNVARAIASADIDGFISKISEAGGAVETFLNDLANAGIIERFAEAVTGLELEVGKPVSLETAAAEADLANLERKIGILKDLIEANKTMAIDTAGAESQLATLLKQAAALRAMLAGAGSMSGQNYEVGTPGDPNALAQQAGGVRAPTVLDPISIKAYPATGGGKGKKGGGKKQNEYQREVEQIRERTAAIEAETKAMAGINPLIDDYGYAVERARAVTELELAAKKAGLEVTPELSATIEQLATSYAKASAEAEKLAESQDKARQNADEMRSLGKDVLGGFIKDLRNGTSAAEALQNALGKIADKLLDMALSSLFGGAGGLGGLLGSIFGFANGGIAAHGKPVKTFARGGVSRSAAVFGEAGPEAAVPLPDGRTIPVTLSLPKMPSASSSRQEVLLHVVGEEGPMFRPAVRAESQDVAVRVSDQRVATYNDSQQRGGVAMNQQHFSSLKRRK